MNFSRLVQTCRRSGISSFQERTLLFIAILAALHAVSCAGASVATQAPQANPQSKIEGLRGSFRRNASSPGKPSIENSAGSQHRGLQQCGFGAKEFSNRQIV